MVQCHAWSGLRIPHLGRARTTHITHQAMSSTYTQRAPSHIQDAWFKGSHKARPDKVFTPHSLPSPEFLYTPGSTPAGRRQSPARMGRRFLREQGFPTPVEGSESGNVGVYIALVPALDPPTEFRIAQTLIQSHEIDREGPYDPRGRNALYSQHPSPRGPRVQHPGRSPAICKRTWPPVGRCYWPCVSDPGVCYLRTAGSSSS